jgi:S-adenosylmethionine:tRNA ribosyltransferase-isomerase
VLPPELVAQEPADKRDESKLLVLNRATGEIFHRQFKDILEFLKPFDCLVLNRTKVIPARILGNKETGGKAEILFLEFNLDSNGLTRALIKPFLPVGKKILFPGGNSAVIEGKNDDGEALIRVSSGNIIEMLEEHGIMPLPPYIKRPSPSTGSGLCPLLKQKDKERYQTVYANEKGSIAAPTAGLHFTPELLSRIKEKGAEVAEIVLHVGWGTFKPITSEDISLHKMLPEYYDIKKEASDKIAWAKKNGGRVITVGTTSTRAIETSSGKHGSGETSIFIYPGYKFTTIDAMITNFHLPRSTPLMMACAFAGKDAIFKAYAEAIEKKYRFYSYGDAMLIV